MGAPATSWLAGAALAAALAAAPPAGAQQDPLVTDLSEHVISIQSNFTGAKVLLFGAVGAEVAGNRDIVIVVRGPDEPVVVRRKARVGGIWINLDSATLNNVPGYYAVVSTRPLAAIAPPAVLERNAIGTGHLRLPIQAASATAGAGEVETFRAALVRLKRARGLYREDPRGVIFLGTSLFRAEVEMPANVPVGVYTAKVYLFENGALAHAQSSPLYVGKAGFERIVFNLAHKQPLYYGIGAVFIACFAGWAASAAFRRS
jgi:uncharacterized protein (TIGR02186 family)